MEEQGATADEQMESLQAKAEEAKEQARKSFAEMGKDYDAEMAEKAEKEGGGPPKFSAVEHLTKLSAMAADAAAEGIVMERVRVAFEDPLLGGAESTGEGAPRHVPQFAHLQPAAGRMDTESSERVRVLVQLALDNDESLAKRDFTGGQPRGDEHRQMNLSGAFLESRNLSGTNLAGAEIS